MYIYTLRTAPDLFCDELHAGKGYTAQRLQGDEFQFSGNQNPEIPNFPNSGIRIPKSGILKQQKNGKLQEQLNCIISLGFILDLTSKSRNSEF